MHDRVTLSISCLRILYNTPFHFFFFLGMTQSLPSVYNFQRQILAMSPALSFCSHCSRLVVPCPILDNDNVITIRIGIKISSVF